MLEQLVVDSSGAHLATLGQAEGDSLVKLVKAVVG